MNCEMNETPVCPLCYHTMRTTTRCRHVIRNEKLFQYVSAKDEETKFCNMHIGDASTWKKYAGISKLTPVSVCVLKGLLRSSKHWGKWRKSLVGFVTPICWQYFFVSLHATNVFATTNLAHWFYLIQNKIPNLQITIYARQWVNKKIKNTNLQYTN